MIKALMVLDICKLLILAFPLVSCVSETSTQAHEDMQFIAGGTFRIGTDSIDLEEIRATTGLSTIEPLLMEVESYQVAVEDFFIDMLDVTNAQFAQFVSANPDWSKSTTNPDLHNGRYLEHWSVSGPPEELLHHPVTFVSWFAAKAYCSWRGKRLPSEAEFEWAAQNPEQRAKYSWGDQLPDNSLVSWGGNGIDNTVPVGSYPANSRGLFDMSGNVWHFTADPWIGSHSETISISKTASADFTEPQARKVVKGGSWGANAANLRIRYRDSHRAFDAREMVGFRCARSVN